MLDDIDKRLIHGLLKEGRKHYVDLSGELNISEGAVRRRLKVLQGNGILRIIAELNVRKLGFGLISVMGIRVQAARKREASKLMADNPHICFLAMVTGEHDFIAIFVNRSSEELGQCIEDGISSIPGLIRVETWIILDTIKGDWPSIDTTQLIDII